MQRHCEKSHGSLPVRWTAAASSTMSSGDVAQTTRSTLNVDRLRSGVTLRQTKISECMGGTKPAARPTSDEDDDDDEDTEVGRIYLFIYLLINPHQRTQFYGLQNNTV